MKNFVKFYYVSLIIIAGGAMLLSFPAKAEAINPPTPISPCGNETVSSLTPELKWQPVADAWFYAWRVGLIGGGDSLATGGTEIKADPPTTATVYAGRLEINKNYHWSVQVENKNGNFSNWSNWCDFNTNLLTPPPAPITPGGPTIQNINPDSGPIGSSIKISGENFACATFTKLKNTVIFTGDNSQSLTDDNPQCDGLSVLKTFIPTNFPASVKSITIEVQTGDKKSGPAIFSVVPTAGGSQTGGKILSKTKLEVNWPNSPMGTPLTINSKLTDLIKYFYEWGIALGGFAAFIALIISGFQYLTSVGNAGKMSNAMNRIRSAGLGLVLLFGSFLILNTINPQLTELKMPTFELGSKSPSIEAQKPINISQNECKSATIYGSGTPVALSAGGEADNLSDVNRVTITGNCKLTLFKLTGFRENSDNGPEIISGEGSFDIKAMYGTTKFHSVRLSAMASLNLPQ